MNVTMIHMHQKLTLKRCLVGQTKCRVCPADTILGITPSRLLHLMHGCDAVAGPEFGDALTNLVDNA